MKPPTRSAAIALIFFLLTTTSWAQATAVKQTVEQRLNEIANNISQTLPKVLDQHTRWDTSAAGPDRRLTHSYTLLTITAGSSIGNRLTTALRPQIVAGFCTDPTMLYYHDNNVTMTYSYRNASGAFVTRFDVNKKDCG